MKRKPGHGQMTDLCPYCEKRPATVPLYDDLYDWMPRAEMIMTCEECHEMLYERQQEDRDSEPGSSMRHGMRSFTGGKL